MRFSQFVVLRRFTCPYSQFNIFAILCFNTIMTGIYYEAFANFEVLTTDVNFNATNFTGNISPVERYIIFTSVAIVHNFFGYAIF